MNTVALDRYGALVREYHRTLDLVSPAALNDWDSLLADALLYGELIDELLPAAGAVLDLGSGVGLPGIPLACTRAGLAVRLVERRRRRSAFLNLVTGQLGLANLSVDAADVSDVTGHTADVITAQAVGRFADVYALTRHLHAGEVLLVSSKGSDWQDEAAELEQRTGVSVSASAVRSRSAGTGLVVGILMPGGR